ncbi:phenylacetate--CoA ligase family protein [Methanolobus bombayensis]|uniref:phenylacetate--CoA ligase family protein n=1 Tax=Methanolobus bombayensis TaxID=38023 RepID=UPI001AE7ECDA|nr:phenylacetate--CoA ligase family protein [Methanolobus bombayensis]MBP1910656.1 phenylacetate-CoA ligase [Methanolobus bombayensis]
MSHLKKALYLSKLMKQQWLTPSEIQEIQNKKIRNIIKHAYTNIPFYRQKFKAAGISPDDIRTVDDLIKVPITTKEELKTNFPDNIVAKGVDLNKCWLPHTSGSTGIPLTIAYGQNDEDYQKAVALRPNLSCGQKIRDKWAVFTSPSHIVQKKWFQKLNIFAPQFISLFDEVDSQINSLESINPNIVDGYSSSIYLLARRLKETENENINPNIIFTTSELLTDNIRNYIESFFDLKVFDQFGCVELGRTAWECNEHCGYHIDADSIVMEFLNDGEQVSAGETGNIVYTGLYNYSMPLIRYSVGDVGIPSDETCNCGRGLPMMKVIEGRADAYMQVPDGRVFSPITWTILMRDIPGVGQYKAIQEKKDLIKVVLVKSDEFSDDTVNQVIANVKNTMGHDITVLVSIVDEIPREKSGKLKSAISHVNINW